AAAEALRRAGITEPPVPLDVLAADVGIPVRAARLPTFFSGALIAEDGMPVALVNAEVAEDVRRRTLAHLLGHALIVLAHPDERYPRNRVREHREADVAANELLLPESFVREQARVWFNDYRYLARLFGVTEPEMVQRMRELGIMKARGLFWEY
ncbi:MAG TPA: ImmA/IrrE family metallo-endopeptidase, partial [Coriobacteriia bacterium]|nr:ImmA/IrrE family metallo-endopeptidase [Coriobacteriia bacterium]